MDKDNKFKLYNFQMGFHNGIAIVREGNKVGGIDIEGNLVIPYAFDAIAPFEGELTSARIGSSWGVIDKRGNIKVPIIYKYILSIQKDAIIVKDHQDKCGVVYENGEPRVPFEYDEIHGFYNGLASVRIGEKWAAMDIDGNRKTDFKYNFMYNYHEGFVIANRDTKWCLIDSNGNEHLWNKYEEFFDFHEGMAIVRNKSGYGAIDINLNEIIPLEYRFLKGLCYGVTIAKNNDKKYGTLDKKGTPVIPFDFDDITELNENLMLVKSGEKEGVYSTKGKLLFPAVHDGIYEAKNGGFILVDGDDYLIIDRDGNIILDLTNTTFDGAHKAYDKYLKEKRRSRLSVVKSVDEMLDTIEKNNEPKGRNI